MNYNLYLIVLFLVLLIVYLIIKIRENNLPVVSFEHFGPESSNLQLNKKQKDKIIEQKIAHKSIAFYAYLISLVIFLALGSFSIFKVIQHMDFKLLQEALPISAGITSTVGFRKLYIKCEKDLNNLR